MHTNPNLPEPTYNENTLFSYIKDTMKFFSSVLKLVRKIFML